MCLSAYLGAGVRSTVAHIEKDLPPLRPHPCPIPSQAFCRIRKGKGKVVTWDGLGQALKVSVS